MDRIALDFGVIQIYWYSIFIFLGIVTGCIVIFKESKKRNIDEEFLINLIFNTLIFGIIGARIYYCLFDFQYYLSNPLEILKMWNGGLAIHGGIITGLVFIIYYCKKNKVNVLKMLDIIVVGLIIGQAIGRWGNFFNSEAYGAITSFEALSQAGIPEFIINGMYILGEYRQPTFFYESVWCIFGFIAMVIIRRYQYLKIGKITGFYLVWYGLERFLIEGMRADSLMLGPIKMAQLISIIFIIVGIIVFFYNNKKGSRFDNLYNIDRELKEERPKIYLK